MAGIERLIVGIIGRCCSRQQLFAGTAAGIDGTAITQSLPGFEVEGPPLALGIWRVRTTAIGAFTPADAKPA
jgi:hypothetical protein